MSPEQVEGKAVDQRSDLYSFGVTIYHLLAGRPPFSGETPLSIAVQHLKTEPDPLSELRPDLPPGICRIVHKLMAKAPEQRYASAADLLRELRTLQPADGDDGFAHDSLAAIDIELNGQEYVGVQATQQLQALMEKTHTIALRARQRHWKRAALALVGAALIGSALAYANRPPDLLAPPKNQTRSRIAKLDNVKEQYLFAIRSPVQSEAAYEAVMEYFPPESGGGENFIYSLRAKQQLARLYRDQGEPAKASQIYDEFINLDPSETEFRVIGYLGLANIESAAGNREAAVTQLSNASKLVTKLSRERQGDLLRTLDEPLRAEWEQRIRDLGAP
jgi:serine/threonine-protein kinase